MALTFSLAVTLKDGTVEIHSIRTWVFVMTDRLVDIILQCGGSPDTLALTGSLSDIESLNMRPSPVTTLFQALASMRSHLHEMIHLYPAGTAAILDGLLWTNVSLNPASDDGSTANYHLAF